MPGKSSTAVLRMRFSAELVSERPYVNMLLYLPYHALAHLGSIATHGRKQSAKPLRDWMENRLSQLCIRERVLTTVITSGAAKCKALQRKLVEKMQECNYEDGIDDDIPEDGRRAECGEENASDSSVIWKVMKNNNKKGTGSTHMRR